MPRDDHRVKQRVRERMRATGERYTVARVAVLSENRLRRLAFDPLIVTLPIDEEAWCRILSQ